MTLSDMHDMKWYACCSEVHVPFLSRYFRTPDLSFCTVPPFSFCTFRYAWLVPDSDSFRRDLWSPTTNPNISYNVNEHFSEAHCFFCWWLLVLGPPATWVEIFNYLKWYYFWLKTGWRRFLWGFFERSVLCEFHWWKFQWAKLDITFRYISPISPNLWLIGFLRQRVIF